MASTPPTVNPRTPRPCRAAFSYVDVLPAATHIGGWVRPPPYGLGSTFRLGTENAGPSWEYSCDSHIFLNSQTTSSQMAVVMSLVRLKVPTSHDPAPRPHPNSKRP